MSAARRKFWGWGFEGQGLDPQEREAVRARVARSYGVDDLPDSKQPRVEEFELRPSRVSPPASLAEICRSEPYERILHAYGRSFPDSVRLFRREIPEPPDFVAYPRREEDVTALLDWADGAGVAVIPFGGGSSVCGGVETAVGDSYRGVVSLDMTGLDQVLEVDRQSRAARIQAGVRGPHLEAQLKEHGYTLRHFPQSFEHSTLGGWIATRSGGHFATLYTHIDDFVESIRAVTPRGLWESRRLPGSGAGPSPDRMMIGSEGILGVITEAWMRLQDRPVHRASSAIRFSSFLAGAQAVRAISQSGLFPSNCRLIDADEAAGSGAGADPGALLVLGFESADHPVDPWMSRAIEIAMEAGGQIGSDGESHREGAVGAWRDAFIAAPFLREILTPAGVIADTFETAVPWNRFEEFHATVQASVLRVLREVSGREGRVTCRFTHVYPDGPAPYFSFQTLGEPDSQLTQWREIKAAANELVTSLGGTITHHHAVGRDHRPGGYDVQRPELFAQALRAAKQVVDPNAILNPGVLIEPEGRSVGITGAMD